MTVLSHKLLRVAHDLMSEHDGALRFAIDARTGWMRVTMPDAREYVVHVTEPGDVNDESQQDGLLFAGFPQVAGWFEVESGDVGEVVSWILSTWETSP